MINEDSRYIKACVQTKIRTEAQFTALNDCNYRLVGRVMYAAMVDLDEFLIPHQHDSLPALLNQLDSRQVLPILT